MKIFLVFVMMSIMPFFAAAQYGGGFAVTVTQQKSMSCDNTTAKALDANPHRSYLLIQNIGSQSMLAYFGASSDTSKGVVIGSGGNYEPFKGIYDSVYLKCPAGSSAVVIEGQ